MFFPIQQKEGFSEYPTIPHITPLSANIAPTQPQVNTEQGKTYRKDKYLGEQRVIQTKKTKFIFKIQNAAPAT
ncbi:MAG: hypothetical protein CSB47_08680 [Proteobacteria bacterium]|nr:MAG: hypothetical protein CSB47_08680 [Pseudomonadota bacterium]